MRGYLKVVGLYDLHVPYHDEGAFSASLAFVSHVKADIVVIGGDWSDFYQVSKFNKDPGRMMELQADLDATGKCLSRLRKASRNAKLIYLRGNHEHRMLKHLWGTQSPLASLRGLRIPELMGLKDLGIDYRETGSARIGRLFFKHGNIVRKKAGYSATAELEGLWTSGVSGHTHRLAQVYCSNEAGDYTWIEAGCLCKLDPEYAEGNKMNWQHGLAYADIGAGGRSRFGAQMVKITNGKITFGGRDISG